LDRRRPAAVVAQGLGQGRRQVRRRREARAHRGAHGKVVVTELSEEDWKRCWSYADVCLSEWREPFVKLCRALREEKEIREAFVSSLGCEPEVFDERWRER